jgi:two-component sensor histidine kinase
VIKKRFLLAILEDLTAEKQQALIDKKRQDELQKEVARRRNAEENLEASLKEKEILLREIHHRVKNNLAIVNSLLRLHSKYATDDFHIRLFADAQTRIRSMSLAHETLYQSENLARLKGGEYLATLVDHLVISVGKTGRKIELSKEIDDIFLELDTAVPLGFVVSELVSNALRHAFPIGASGHITVSLRVLAGDQLELIIKDDGIGLPKDFDPANPQTFGFKLINLFSDQLNGELSIPETSGTEIRLVFGRTIQTYGDEK